MREASVSRRSARPSMVKAGLLEPELSGLAQVPRRHGCYWTCEQVRFEYTQQIESGPARLPVMNGEASEQGTYGRRYQVRVKRRDRLKRETFMARERP